MWTLTVFLLSQNKIYIDAHYVLLPNLNLTLYTT